MDPFSHSQKYPTTTWSVFDQKHTIFAQKIHHSSYPPTSKNTNTHEFTSISTYTPNIAIPVILTPKTIKTPQKHPWICVRGGNVPAERILKNTSILTPWFLTPPWQDWPSFLPVERYPGAHNHPRNEVKSGWFLTLTDFEFCTFCAHFVQTVCTTFLTPIFEGPRGELRGSQNPLCSNPRSF